LLVSKFLEYTQKIKNRIDCSLTMFGIGTIRAFGVVRLNGLGLVGSDNGRFTVLVRSCKIPRKSGRYLFKNRMI